MLITLGVLAAAAILASEAPRIAAWPVAFVAFGFGLWRGRRELRQPARVLLVPARDGVATLDGVPMMHFDVQWRGPLAFLQWRDAQGLRRRMQFWPDTLSAPVRRELRLAMIHRTAAAAAGSMAP
ncbi:MAG: hypothetical protein ACYC42_00810 [Lysobacter sp.]